MVSKRPHRERHPHPFSKGRTPPGFVGEGSWDARWGPPRPLPRSLSDLPETSVMPAPRLKSPMLQTLVTGGEQLAIRCTTCKRDKRYSALEAVASYGGLVTFEELGALIRGRCRKPGCAAKASARAGG